MERFEQLSRHGSLFRLITAVEAPKTSKTEQSETQLKLSVPFHFTKERLALDYRTNLNRYHLLTHLAKSTTLETLTFSDTGKPARNYGEDVLVRHVEVEEGKTLGPAWYAADGYDGLLLLSQSLTDDLLYYQLPNVPIVHYIGDDQRSQDTLPETLLTLAVLQRPKDTLVVKSSWLKQWLDTLELPGTNVQVVHDGINVVKPISKALAKQHTTELFENPMFAQQPVVGLISGFEPNYGAQLINAFANANPNIALFVYDPILAEHYTDPPENVVIFSTNSKQTDAVLPILLPSIGHRLFPRHTWDTDFIGFGGDGIRHIRHRTHRIRTP